MVIVILVVVLVVRIVVRDRLAGLPHALPGDLGRRIAAPLAFLNCHSAALRTLYLVCSCSTFSSKSVNVVVGLARAALAGGVLGMLTPVGLLGGV
jgi:hypothetical protein